MFLKDRCQHKSLRNGFGSVKCTVVAILAQLGLFQRLKCISKLLEGFSDIAMFCTLPYSSLERTVAPLGLCLCVEELFFTALQRVCLCHSVCQ